VMRSIEIIVLRGLPCQSLDSRMVKHKSLDSKRFIAKTRQRHRLESVGYGDAVLLPPFKVLIRKALSANNRDFPLNSAHSDMVAQYEIRQGLTSDSWTNVYYLYNVGRRFLSTRNRSDGRRDTSPDLLVAGGGLAAALACTEFRCFTGGLGSCTAASAAHDEGWTINPCGGGVRR